jgi:hypothetical protein
MPHCNVPVCRWGPRLEDHTFRTKYRMYISEQVRFRAQLSMTAVWNGSSRDGVQYGNIL